MQVAEFFKPGIFSLKLHRSNHMDGWVTQKGQKLYRIVRTEFYFSTIITFRVFFHPFENLKNRKKIVKSSYHKRWQVRFQTGFDPIVFGLVRWVFRTGCFSIIGDLENNPCFDMEIFQIF